MDTVDKLLLWLFLLSLAAMALIFYVGLSTDATTLFNGITNLWGLAMGRVNGKFGYANSGN